MSIYTKSTIGTDANQIVFNDDDADIYFRVRSRAPQSRDVRQLDVSLPFESGVSDFRTLIGKTAYVIAGTMYPDDEDASDRGIRMLRKLASLDVSQSDPDSDYGYVPYMWGEGDSDEPSKKVYIKILYVELVESTTGGIVQNFRLIGKIKDPTIHSVELRVADTSASDPTTASGTALFPFKYPIIYGASTYSVSSVLTNNGDMEAYPEAIEIHGPVTNPIVTNGRTGEYIRVNVALNTADDVLRIVYNKEHLAVELNGESVLSEVHSASEYFKLLEGANQITLSGDTINSGAYVRVTAYDAFPLS